MSVKSICGVILLTDQVEGLVAFYTGALGLDFEREDHGGLDVHYGVDIGEVHFGIHPPSNFKGRGPSRATPIAFAVTALSDHLEACTSLGAEVIVEPHDEGFGSVATLADPEGNLFELVELTHQFSAGEPSRAKP